MRSIYILIFLKFILIHGDITINPSDQYGINIKENGENGFILTANKDGVEKYKSIIGKSLDNKYTSSSYIDGKYVYDFKDQRKLEIFSKTVENNDLLIQFKWIAPKNIRLEDCINLGSYQWYGGPQQREQYWPVQSTILKNYSFVTKAFSGISEPYWLNSDGTVIYVKKEVPLFVDQNNILKNNLCLISEIKDPYSGARPYNELSYDIVLTNNAKSGHEYAVKNYLGKPKDIPSVAMVDRPIFTLWPRYSEAINQSVILNLAHNLKERGFKSAIIELDDFWETCPGSFVVDPKKYPDFKKMIQDIKQMGYNFTLWIHPFVYYFCEPWITEVRDKGYIVKSEDGNLYTSISNSEIKESHIDFTNPDAKSWWIKRVKDLQNTYDLDGLKYCAGESMYTAQIALQKGEIRLQPSHITSDYVRTAENLNGNNIVRPGQRTQDLPIFIYMGDKDFIWSSENGLPTVITTLLQNNINGYPFVIANMINSDISYKENKELYVRWIQASTFIPNLQIPYKPWDFDDETVEILRKYLNLHVEYKSSIENAMKNSVANGTPVNSPIWWIDPTDEEALKIWDEYLLGENILVAPILQKGSTSRDIYLPSGQWKYIETGTIYDGRTWIKNFSANLNTLPFFVKV